MKASPCFHDEKGVPVYSGGIRTPSKKGVTVSLTAKQLDEARRFLAEASDREIRLEFYAQDLEDGKHSPAFLEKVTKSLWATVATLKTARVALSPLVKGEIIPFPKRKQ